VDLHRWEVHEVDAPGLETERQPDPVAPPDDLGAATATGRALVAAVERVVLGHPEAARLAVAALLAGGHVLVEDVPGVGKTLFAKALARALGGTSGRVQGTADLLPSDVTGVSTYDPGAGAWRFHPGPLFHEVVLFDEINRATPRAQSALLEAMAEQQVTVDGTTHALPSPQLVVATQNPLGDGGTFPLPDGARDRFAVVVRFGPLPRAAERAVVLGVGGRAALDDLRPVVAPGEVARAVAAVRAVHVVDGLVEYVLDVAAATRRHPAVVLGASPRAAQVLLGVARALAVLAGRDHCTPDDVKDAARPVLAHRLVLQVGAGPLDAADEVVAGIVGTIPAPVV
jgi:MoxR-like ATPase